MKCVSICLRALLGALLFAPNLHAQITATAPAASGEEGLQRFDIYGGAAYSHFNPGYAHRVNATNLLGWDGSATAWFAKSYGLEATVRSLYGNYNIPANAYGLTGTSDMAEYLFLFGPTFRLLETPKYTLGMHAQVGGGYGSFDKGFANSGVEPFLLGVYNNQLAFAGVIGGWADLNVRPRFAVRFKADYTPTRYGATTQNEFNGTVGIVYKLGSRGK